MTTNDPDRATPVLRTDNMSPATLARHHQDLGEFDPPGWFRATPNELERREEQRHQEIHDYGVKLQAGLLIAAARERAIAKQKAASKPRRAASLKDVSTRRTERRPNPNPAATRAVKQKAQRRDVAKANAARSNERRKAAAKRALVPVEHLGEVMTVTASGAPKIEYYDRRRMDDRTAARLAKMVKAG